MMRYYRRLPAEQLDQVIPPVEGLAVQVTEDCVGCGTCLEYCAFDAIIIRDEVAIHDGRCRGCGRCAANCPREAVKISIDNPDAVADVEKRIESYLDEY
jgi:UDP-glucose 4-epimerase